MKRISGVTLTLIVCAILFLVAEATTRTRKAATTSNPAFKTLRTGAKIGVQSNGIANLSSSQVAGNLGPVTILPGLGNYSFSSMPLSGNTTITPDAAPTDTLYATATTSAALQGMLAVDPTSGVVRVTNAHPEGFYTVTVTAYNGNASTTKSFTLHVFHAIPCGGFSPTTNFEPPVNSTVGQGPNAVAIGDFNGDGKQDIVTANKDGATASVLSRNAANTGFDPKIDVVVGGAPYSVAVADFNGDGKQDFVTANSANNVSVVLRNAANTGFDPKVDVVVGSAPYSVAVADFNGDGKADIVTANRVDATVSVLLRNADNTGFDAKVDYQVGSDPGAVAVGDFNGDGKPDIVTANYAQSTVSVCLRNSSNTGFDSHTEFVVGSSSAVSVAVGDINGDGRQDIVTSKFDNSVSVLLNAANTGFFPHVDFPLSGEGESVALGDFNLDGRQDIAVAVGTQSQGLSVLLRNSTNTGFDPRSDFTSGGQFPVSVTVGDFNGDGAQDLVTANNNSASVSVFQRRCNSAPHITILGPLTMQQGTTLTQVPIATVSDPDQPADTLTVTATLHGGPGVSVTNVNVAPSGTVTATVTVSCFAGPSDFTVGVIDNMNWSSGLGLTVNVTPNTAPTLAFGNQSVAFGGSLDVSPMTASDNGPVTYSLQPGHGLTTLPTVNSAGVVSITNARPSGPHSVTVRGTDNCGTVTDTSFTLEVGAGPPTPTLGNYANPSDALSGNTTVTPDASPTNTDYATATTTPDFKGKLETDPLTGVVRVTNAHPAGSYSVTVHAYNLAASTTKTFTLTVTTPAPCDAFGPTAFAASAHIDIALGSTFSVAVGDFNGDGKQDLVTTNGGNNVSVLLRNAANTGFDPKVDFTVGTTPFAVAIGDFNGDGKQDIVTANVNSNTVSVLLRNAANTGFDPKVDFAVGSHPDAVAVGDFNGDGKLDIVAGNQSNNTVSVLLHNADNTGFDPKLDFVVGGQPYGVAVGDFNGDGKLDIITANSIANTVTMLLRNAANTGFDPKVDLAVGVPVKSVAGGDFNGDGKQDIVTANPTSDNVSVFLRNGANSGFDPKVDFVAGSGPVSVAVGDFNGDGKQDLVTANNHQNPGNNVTVLLRNSANTGFDAPFPFAVGFIPQDLAVGDFNGDNRQDVVTAYGSNGEVLVLERKCNTAPTITAAAPLSQRRGSPATNSQIAAVSDIDQAANTLSVTATPLTGTGVTVNNVLVNGAGNVTADVAASCTATDSTFTLRVTDNATATATVTLTVNVTLNTAPTLLYANQSVAFGGALAVSPTVAGDNGTVVGYAVQPGHGLTTAPTVDSAGVVTITNAQPGGTHTITVRATDNCGATTDSAFMLEVGGAPMTIQFSAPNYPVSESTAGAIVAVTRGGNTTGAATVNYATSDTSGANNCNVFNGAASSRCDYLTTLGTLNFAANEISKTITIPIVDDAYAEGSEVFTITLSSASGVALGSPATATVTITDNDANNGTNPIDVAGFFVRQHYIDFLNREPDTSGLNFWTNQITSCGADAACTEVKRVNVSASFFVSIEFRETGYLVERFYKASYADASGTSTFHGTHQLPVPIVRFNEFLSDTQEIGQGVIVGQGNWQQQLEDNKNAFAAEFVQRSRFTTAFPGSLTPAQFVDTLNVNAGNPLSVAERNQLVADLTNSTKTRAQVLRAVAEDADLANAEINKAFVLMQYFGYLRRNPNDPQDSDYTGYDFWLTKLNQFNGNYINAEMVKAFISSIEYRQRFGP